MSDNKLKKYINKYIILALKKADNNLPNSKQFESGSEPEKLGIKDWAIQTPARESITKIFYLSLNGKNQYVVKFHRKRKSLNRTVLNIEHFLKHKQNVPDIIYFDNSLRTRFALGYYISVESFVEGKHLDEVDLTSDIISSFAVELAKVHSVKRCYPGLVNCKYHCNLSNCWLNIVNDRIKLMKRRGIGFDLSELQIIKSYFKNEANSFKDRVVCELTHHDLYPDNIIIDSNNSIWFIDTMRAWYGIYAWDLTEILYLIELRDIGLKRQFEDVYFKNVAHITREDYNIHKRFFEAWLHFRAACAAARRMARGKTRSKSGRLLQDDLQIHKNFLFEHYIKKR